MELHCRLVLVPSCPSIPFAWSIQLQGASSHCSSFAVTISVIAHKSPIDHKILKSMFGGVYDSWKGLVAANCRVDCFVDLIITMLYSHGFVDSIRKTFSKFYLQPSVLTCWLILTTIAGRFHRLKLICLCIKVLQSPNRRTSRNIQ